MPPVTSGRGIIADMFRFVKELFLFFCGFWKKERRKSVECSEFSVKLR